jgi:ketosteroid isomerase-like protein
MDDNWGKIAPAKAMIEAFARRDTEAFVACMTADVLLRPSAFITGTGEYKGRDEIRAGMAQFEQQLRHTGERVDVAADSYFVDAERDDQVLVLGTVTVTRADRSYGSEIAYLCSMRDERIAKLETWLDHQEGLDQLKCPLKVE